MDPDAPDLQAMFAGMKSQWKSANVPVGDYDADRDGPLMRTRTGLAPGGGSADYHNRNEADYYKRIEKARAMDRNDAVIGQIIDRSVANEIQDGFQLQINTGDKSLDDTLQAMWHDWSTNPDLCDIRGEMTFYDYEIAACRAAKLDGDCVVTGVYDEWDASTHSGPLQFFEAHNIGTNRRIEDVFLGVHLNSRRKPIKYYVACDLVDPYKTRGVGGFGGSEIEMDVRNEDGVRQLFHVYNPKRVTLTRGVTALAPVFQLAGMFEDTNFAKLLQQQIVSCFAIFHEMPQAIPGEGGSLPSNQGYGYSSTETTRFGTRKMEGIMPGMEIWGKPGAKMHGFSPAVPNPEYFTHVKLILQLIGVNLGLPLCLVLMDGSETNFSGWRGAVDEARKGFRRNQQNMIKRFHTPAYLWKLHHFMADDPAIQRAIDSNSNINVYEHRWQPQAWAYIEPEKDARGDAIQIDSKLTSRRRVAWNRGGEFQEIAIELVGDNAFGVIEAKKRAAEINAEFPDDNEPVSWRELWTPTLSSGTSMTLESGGTDALALQQLALASERADKQGDAQLGRQIRQLMENGAQ